MIELPELDKRLFRAVDVGKDETYHVYNPTLRDSSFMAGLNKVFCLIEDNTGLARGTLADAASIARTATELNIMRNRSTSTVRKNQEALQECLEDVIYAANVFTTLYSLAPEGDYELTFEWGDSILEDGETEYNQKQEMVAAGEMSPLEFRMWYFKEDEETAAKAIAKINKARSEASASVITDVLNRTNTLVPKPE